MKKILFSFTFTLLIQYAFSQSDTFDIFSYKVPEFFARQTLANSIVLSMSDKSGTACTITLYKSQPSKESDLNNLNRQWNEQIVKRYNGVTSQPQIHAGQVVNNWKTSLGIGNCEINKKKNIVILNSYTGQDRTAFVVYSFNDPVFQGPIGIFSDNLKLVSDQTTQIQVTTKTTAPTNIPIVTGPVPEVWMNTQVNPMATGRYSDISTQALKAHFYLIYPDGDYFPRMPAKGILSFDKAVNKAGKEGASWGRFMIQQGKGLFKSKLENIAVEKSSPTEMKKTGYTFGFYKCALVDGLTLNGGWSYIFGWTRNPYYSQPGSRPVIYFKPDGSFDDRGIFVSNFNDPNKTKEDAPGTGTYSIKSFTLVLKYTDGRERHCALTGVINKNPFTENNVLYIGGNPFSKK